MDYTPLAILGAISGITLSLSLYGYFKGKVLPYAVPIDLFMLFVAPLLSGLTPHGIVIAGCAGVMTTVVFFILEHTCESEHIAFRKHRGLPQMYWRVEPPKKLPIFNRGY